MGHPNGLKDEFLDHKHKGKKGTIIIEFYKTVQFERKNRPNQVHTKQYEQHFIEDANKKSFAESIRIKEGKQFTLPPKNGGVQGGGNRRFNGPPPHNNNFNNRNGGGPTSHQNDFRKRDSKYEDKQQRNYSGGFGGRTLSVSTNSNNSRGGQFNKSNLPGGALTDDGMIIDYRVDFDHLVDTIVINYADWSFL